MDPEGKGPQGSYSMQDFLLSSEEEQLMFLLLSNPSHESKTAEKKQLWAVQLMRFLKVVASFSRAATRITLESKTLGIDGKLDREEQEPEAEQHKGEKEKEGETEEEDGIIPPEEIDMRALEILSRLVEEWEMKRMEYFFKKKNTNKDAPDISPDVLKAEEARLNDDGPLPAVERQEEEEKEATADLPEKVSRILDDTERPSKDAQRQGSPASTPVKLTEEYDKPVPNPNFGCLYSEMFRDDPKPYSKVLLPRNTGTHSLSLKSSPSTPTSFNDNIVGKPNSSFPLYKPTPSDKNIARTPSDTVSPDKPTSSYGNVTRIPSKSVSPDNLASSNDIISKTPSNSGFSIHKPLSSSDIIARKPSNLGSPPHKPTSSSDIITRTPSNSDFSPHKPTPSSDIVARTPSNAGSPHKLTSSSDVLEKILSNSGFPSYNPTYPNNKFSGEPINSAFLHCKPIRPLDSVINSCFNSEPSLGIFVDINSRKSRTPPIPHSNASTFYSDSFSREPSSPIYGGSTHFEAVSLSTPKGQISMPPATNDQYVFIPEHTRRAHTVSSYYRKDGTFVRGYERGPSVVKAHWRKKN